MKKKILTAAALMVMADVAIAGCKSMMTEFTSADVNLAANYGAQSMIAAMYYKNSFQPEVFRIETMYGNLQAIPINIGSAAGTTTMQMSWAPMIIGLAKKLENSYNRFEDPKYLTAPLGERAAVVAQYVGACAMSDGETNVIVMIDEAAKAGVLPQFLGKAAIYLKKPQKNPNVVEYPEIGTVPYSKMPPI